MNRSATAIALIVAVFASLASTTHASAQEEFRTQTKADVCRDRVKQAIGGILSLDWHKLAGALDAESVAALESRGKAVRFTDRDALLRLLSATEGPGRARRRIRVEPIAGTDTYFRVTLTDPYTYIDDPMVEDPAPCFVKPVELCVQLVDQADGPPRLKLEYPLNDLIYLLQ